MQDWPSCSPTAQALLPEVMVQGLPTKLVPLVQSPSQGPMQEVHSDSRADPVPAVVWPAWQAKQEVEAWAGWYLPVGQRVHSPVDQYLPDVQAVQDEEPVPGVP